MSTERTLTCQELTEVLTDYLEGAMAPADRTRLEAHLELCEGCANYLTQMRQTIAATHVLQPEEVEATAPDELLAAFRAWKRGEDQPKVNT